MTHWHLSHTPTMNYKSSVQTARVQFSLEMLGQVVLQAPSPWQELFPFATSQRQNVEAYLKME